MNVGGPSRRHPSSSTPPAKGRPEETSREGDGKGKEFKLPARKQPVESKEEKQSKKKGLFDIAASDAKVQGKEQSISQEMAAETTKSGAMSGIDAAQEVSKIAKLIQQTVETMHIGQVGESHFASLNLKTTAEIPAAFAGSNLTISYQENGIVIHFDNFMTPQQQNNAITLVEQHKEQLQEMIQALSSKNIQVAEMSIGAYTVALPRVQPLPPPFQPTAAPRADAEQQRGGEEGREGKDREEQ